MIKHLEDMTLADDFMFGAVMSKEENAKEFLEYLFGKEIKRIQSITPQAYHKVSLDSKGTRFDVEFVGDNKIYDIEMQTTGSESYRDSYALVRRVRYYQGNIDVSHFTQGQQYKEMKDTYVIFICTFDPFGYGLSRYTQVPYIQEIQNRFVNGAVCVYLNIEYIQCNVNAEIAALLKYLKDPNNVQAFMSTFVSRLHKDVGRAKLNPEVRRGYMSMDEVIRQERAEAEKEGREKGLVEGREEGKAEAVQECIENLVASTGVTIEEARKMLSKGGRAASSSLPELHFE